MDIISKTDNCNQSDIILIAYNSIIKLVECIPQVEGFIMLGYKYKLALLNKYAASSLSANLTIFVRYGFLAATNYKSPKNLINNKCNCLMPLCSHIRSASNLPIF